MNCNYLNQRVITDYVTGKSVLDIGAEANRQAVEKYLVEEKGYTRDQIIVDMELVLEISGEPYRTRLDLVVFMDNLPVMVIKCAAGSLFSREREVIYAARVAQKQPIPIAVASDGHDAVIFDAMERKLIGQGLASIPSPEDARQILKNTKQINVTTDKREKERIIFRSYDIMNVNVPDEDVR